MVSNLGTLGSRTTHSALIAPALQLQQDVLSFAPKVLPDDGSKLWEDGVEDCLGLARNV